MGQCIDRCQLLLMESPQEADGFAWQVSPNLLLLLVAGDMYFFLPVLLQCSADVALDSEICGRLSFPENWVK